MSSFAEILSGGVVQLVVVGDDQRLVVHRLILAKAPQFASLTTTDEPVVVEASTFAVAVVVEFLYDVTKIPFTDLPNSLETKIAIAEVFLLAEQWGVDELATMAKASLKRVMLLKVDEQLQFWKFVYGRTTTTSAIRIPNMAGLTAHAFVKGLQIMGMVEELDRSHPDLIRDLLFLAVAETDHK